MSALPIAWRVAFVAALVAAAAVLVALGPTVWDAARHHEREQAAVMQVARAAAGADLAQLAERGVAARFDAEGAPLEVVPESFQQVAAELAAGCLARSGTSSARVAPFVEGWAGACAADGEGWVVVGWPAEGGAVSSRLWALTLTLSMLAAGLVATAVRRGLAPLDALTSAAGRLARGQPMKLELPEEPELRPVASALVSLAAAQQERDDAVAARLELSQQLAGIVAHEVRNPLQSLAMLTDLACHEVDAERRRDHLTAITRELQLVEEVVQRLVAGGEHLHLVVRTTDVRLLAQRCLDLVGVEGGTDLELRGDGHLEVDAALVRRALENLVRNAAREAARVRVSIIDGGLTVDDDGPGVAADQRHTVFQAGVSGHGGTGLGLALARRVAEAHGGSLRCEASDLGGARFVLRLVPGDA